MTSLVVVKVLISSLIVAQVGVGQRMPSPFVLKETGVMILLESRQIQGFAFESKTISLDATSLIADYQLIHQLLVDVKGQIARPPIKKKQASYLTRNPKSSSHTDFAEG